MRCYCSFGSLKSTFIPQVLYDTNIKLVNQLIDAMETERVTPHVLFSSSIQEEFGTLYGLSKQEGRYLFENWARNNSASFTGIIIPNIFGPFGMPDYNSFIATFCYKLTHGETPQVYQDDYVKLIYIDSIVNYIRDKIDKIDKSKLAKIECNNVEYDFEMKVTAILALLENFKVQYFDKGFIPELKDRNEINLFNTFRCYMEHSNVFPRKLVQHIDTRGTFVETIRMGIGGQVSYSKTVSGVTRGDHFHTRKIERFTVIEGKARIKMRRIGTKKVLDFYLNGSEPAYVDIPIWYTHNITNIGDDELCTQFWINEWYDPDDKDTFFELVG